MTGLRFISEPAEGGIVSALEGLQPENPFATAAYFESRRRLGYSTWVLGLQAPDETLATGCGAMLKRGRLNSTLEILSLPNLEQDSKFWSGLRDFCHRHRITQLELNTFSSPSGTDAVPISPRWTRKRRSEFVIDLSSDLSAILSKTHRQNVRKARKAGLTVVRSQSAESATTHQDLMNESLYRRRERGEDISAVARSPEITEIIRSGAGELFQAVKNGIVISSGLVLRSSRGAYYHTSGTSAEGMSVGASHFLIHNIAIVLKTEGLGILNLGGADEGSALASYKRWFGASPVPLTSANCYLGPTWRYKVSRLVLLARSDPGALGRLIVGNWSRLLVYSVDVPTAKTSVPMPELEFRPLNLDDLQSISVSEPSFRSRQLERVKRFGDSYAYGVYCGGRLAHISWLLPPQAIARDLPRVVPGTEGDAEITGCETLAEFRGRGIYPFAIQRLIDTAREKELRRVFMKTSPENLASQRGIERAGLRRIGSAVLVTLPMANRQMIWRRFR